MAASMAVSKPATVAVMPPIRGTAQRAATGLPREQAEVVAGFRIGVSRNSPVYTVRTGAA
jgi:hypothetical protein